MGGTMRLGAYDCQLLPGTRIGTIYDEDRISERHRHRYEININYKERLEEAGLRFSGMSPDGSSACSSTPSSNRSPSSRTRSSPPSSTRP